MADFGGVDLDAFRAEARTWLAANYPPSLRGDPEAGQRITMGGAKPTGDQLVWKQRMADKGWGAPTWQKPYGAGVDHLRRQPGGAVEHRLEADSQAAGYDAERVTFQASSTGLTG